MTHNDIREATATVRRLASAIKGHPAHPCGDYWTDLHVLYTTLTNAMSAAREAVADERDNANRMAEAMKAAR